MCWFVFHCHGNEIKISSMMADTEGIKTNVRTCSNLTADTLAALFAV